MPWHCLDLGQFFGASASIEVKKLCGYKLRWTVFFIDHLPVVVLISALLEQRLIKVIVSGTTHLKKHAPSVAHFQKSNNKASNNFQKQAACEMASRDDPKLFVGEGTPQHQLDRHIFFFWLNDRGTMRWVNWSYFMDEWNCGQAWNIKLSKMADTFLPCLPALWSTVETLRQGETNEAWNCKFTLPSKQCELNGTDTTTNKIHASIWFMIIHFPPWFLIAFGCTCCSFQFFCLSLRLPERKHKWLPTETEAGQLDAKHHKTILSNYKLSFLTYCLVLVVDHCIKLQYLESKTMWLHTKSKQHVDKQVFDFDLNANLWVCFSKTAFLQHGWWK